MGDDASPAPPKRNGGSPPAPPAGKGMGSEPGGRAGGFRGRRLVPIAANRLGSSARDHRPKELPRLRALPPEKASSQQLQDAPLVPPTGKLQKPSPWATSPQRRLQQQQQSELDATNLVDQPGNRSGDGECAELASLLATAALPASGDKSKRHSGDDGGAYTGRPSSSRAQGEGSAGIAPLSAPPVKATSNGAAGALRHEDGPAAGLQFPLSPADEVTGGKGPPQELMQGDLFFNEQEDRPMEPGPGPQPEPMLDDTLAAAPWAQAGSQPGVFRTDKISSTPTRKTFGLPSPAEDSARDSRLSFVPGGENESGQRISGQGKQRKEKARKLTIVPVNFSGASPSIMPNTADDNSRLLFTTCIVKCPCISVFIMLLLPVAMSILVLINAPPTLDISPEGFAIRESHFSQQRQASMLEALAVEREHFRLRRRQLGVIPAYRLGRIQIIYEPIELADPHVAAAAPNGLKHGDLLQWPRLERIREIEQLFRNFKDFNRFCSREPHLFTGCVPPSSLMTFLYPRVNPDNCRVSYDGLGTKMVRPLAVALRELSHVEDSEFFFPAGRTGTASSLLRSQFEFALDHVPSPEEKAQFRDWLSKIRKPLSDLAGNGVNVYIGGEVLTEILILGELSHDMTMALLSLLLVLIYTAVHTGSLVLAVMTIAMIALSFPVSFFVYYTLFGTTTVGVLNVLSIYIVLGIGVDDCYVFLDGYKQCRLGSNVGSLDPAVFGSAISRAARAMFVTTITTALAFLANMISSIPVIYSFAVFMGTIVIVNYIFAVTIFVGCVAVWAAYIEPHELRLYMRCYQRCPRNRLARSMIQKIDSNVELQPIEHKKNSCCGKSTHPEEDHDENFEAQFEGIHEITADPTPSQLDDRKKKMRTEHNNIVRALQNAKILGENSSHKELRMTEQFFLCKFGPFVANYRREILATSTVVVVIGIIMSTSLKASDEIPKLFERKNPIQRFLDYQETNFTGSHCTDCAAAFKSEFMCRNVDCGPGNTCQYGDCYDHNVQLQQHNLPCELAPERLAAQCEQAWGSIEHLGTRDYLNPAQRLRTSEDITQAVLRIWRPDSDFATSTCKDNFKECYAWAERGECDAGFQFMSRQCRFSCGLCVHTIENYWECMDDIDNDGDGVEDCDDTDCARHPLCASSHLTKQLVYQAVCGSDVCMSTIDNFVSNCPNGRQRAQIKYDFNVNCRSLWNLRNKTYLTTSPARPSPTPAGSSHFCPYVDYVEPWEPPSVQWNQTQVCQCGTREGEFYAFIGVLFFVSGTFVAYTATKNGLLDPPDVFMQRLNLQTCGMMYLISMPSIAMWLACTSGGDTKERGFFILMSCIIICDAGWLAIGNAFIFRKLLDDPAPRPRPTNRTIYYRFFIGSGMILAIGLCMCIIGLVTTFSFELKVFSQCEDAVFDRNETVQNGVQGDSLIAQEYVHRVCVPVEECGAGESMAMAMLSIPTSLVGTCVVPLLAFWKRDAPRPSILSVPMLLPFPIHGLIGVYFWIACTSENRSQEKQYFIALLSWSCLTMLFQIAWSVKRKYYLSANNRRPAMILLAISLLAVSVGGFGVYVTSWAGKPWFGACYTDSDLLARQNVAQVIAEAEDMSDADTLSAVRGIHEQAERTRASSDCVIDEECGPLESAIYGAVGLALLLFLGQATCVHKFRLLELPKSVNGCSIVIFLGFDLILLSSWMVCSSSDSTIEKPFFIVTMTYSILALGALSYMTFRSPETRDAGLAIMMSIFSIGVAGSVWASVILFGNRNPVLGTCDLQEPCHWWNAGMPLQYECDMYWQRLREDHCSKARCGGHGLCVGFARTGKKLLSRFCANY
eukprot:SAG31_NODE_470_length_15239_cov_19.376288_5_plen_1816_part_00